MNSEIALAIGFAGLVAGFRQPRVAAMSAYLADSVRRIARPVDPGGSVSRIERPAVPSLLLQQRLETTEYSSRTRRLHGCHRLKRALS